MAQLPSDVGHGVTLTLATSTFESVVLNSITWSGMSRGSVETTGIATAVAGAGKLGNRTFIPTRNTDAGELSFGCNFDPSATPPLEGVVELVTITWLSDATPPIAAGNWSCNGFCTGFEIDEITADDKMTATFTYKLTGSVTIAATP